MPALERSHTEVWNTPLYCSLSKIAVSKWLTIRNNLLWNLVHKLLPKTIWLRLDVLLFHDIVAACVSLTLPEANEATVTVD